MHLVDNSAGREMSVEKDKLHAAIDQKGRHLLYSSEPIGEGLLRTQWYVRLKGWETPTEIWMDINSEKLNEVGTVIELDVPEDDK